LHFFFAATADFLPFFLHFFFAATACVPPAEDSATLPRLIASATVSAAAKTSAVLCPARPEIPHEVIWFLPVELPVPAPS
jgi:hypothetical protein